MKNITDVDKNLEMKTVNKDDLKAYHVRDKCFTIYGSYAPESDTLFRRVPEEVAKNMSDGAHFLHTNTAGIRVRFKTDSQYIALKPTIPSAANMNNSIITCICISLFFVLYGLSLTQDVSS